MRTKTALAAIATVAIGILLAGLAHSVALAEEPDDPYAIPDVLRPVCDPSTPLPATFLGTPVPTDLVRPIPGCPNYDSPQAVEARRAKQDEALRERCRESSNAYTNCPDYSPPARPSPAPAPQMRRDLHAPDDPAMKPHSDGSGASSGIASDGGVVERKRDGRCFKWTPGAVIPGTDIQAPPQRVNCP